MNTKEKAEALLKKAKKFILCGIDAQGYPTAKAVLPSKERDSLAGMYFVTNTGSNYVGQIKANDKASVYFFSSVFYKGCLLKGKMETCDDETVKARLWKNSYKGAYPEPDKKYLDPDFCVLKFTPESGRYYSFFKTSEFEI